MNSDLNNFDDQNAFEQDVPTRPLFGRRSFVGLATLSAAAVMTGVDKVHAGLFYSTKPVEGIPDEWVKEKGTDVLRYANYIKDLDLKNITPYMVLRPHFKKRGNVSNSLPPRYMWKRLAHSLKVIDRLAYELNSPVKELLSLYRSTAYNRACRGRSKSQHMENRAIDVKFARVGAYTAGRKAKQMRDKGYFKGGIGTYSSFLHIDTRGENATW